MNYYRLLNLPSNPLKDIQFVIDKYTKVSLYGYRIASKDLLTHEVIDSLSKTGLDIDFIVIFQTYNKSGDIAHRLIHSDLTWDNEWKKISFGVNWEIGEDKDDVYFRWWDMSRYEEKFPPDDHNHITDPNFFKLSGIHYNERLSLGVPEEAVLLEKTCVSQPILVRTDIPHCVAYSGTKRMSLSIRFKQLLDWDSAVKAFDSLILK